MFIVFEGCDKTGKTTHSKNLFEALKPGSLGLIAFPYRNTKIGKFIDNYLKNNYGLGKSINPRVSHLLFSANRWEFYNTLNHMANIKEMVLISDRYYFSGVVYTKTLDNTIPIEWLENVDEGLPEPDLVLYLYNVRPEHYNFRPKMSKEIYEIEKFQREAKKNYEDIYLSKRDNWIPIDTSRPELEVFKEILDKVKRFIEEKNN